MLDARYTRTSSDEPVELPMSSRRVPYAVAIAVLVAVVGIIAGLLVASRSAAAPNADSQAPAVKPVR